MSDATNASPILPSGAWTDATKEEHHVFDAGLATALALWFKDVAPCRVVDLGCGTGSYVKTIRMNCPGIDVKGYDGNPNTPALSDHCPDVEVYDLTSGGAAGIDADWVLCLEVGEHVPPQYEEAVWRHLDRATSGVILSWARDNGPADHGHCNPRPPQYVTEKMAALGFVEGVPAFFREPAQAPWFRENLRTFFRPQPQGAALAARLQALRRPVIFLAMPHSGNPVMAAARALWTAKSRQATVHAHSHQTSALCRNFNLLWSEALNLYESGQITHFAMLHDDNVPADGFLDLLLEDLELSGADLVAACPAIKDDRGLLSTAIEDPLAGPWEVAKRLTTAEFQSLPDRFDAADCGYPGRAILANTGCWLADLRRPIFRAAGPLYPFYFTMRDQIERDPASGRWAVKFQSEDWLFSQMFQSSGGKVVCTRRVAVGHVGPQVWPNHVAWGRLAEDDCGTVAGLKAVAQQIEAESHPGGAGQ